MEDKEIIASCKEAFQIEIDSLNHTLENVGESYAKAVKMILAGKGRTVLIGMGKSGIIGKKIAATLASTGTPAFFIHPAEGMHGDLGMLSKDDVVIAISNSGETDEMKALIPLIKRLDIKMIAITGGKDSTLARMSDCVLDSSIEKEACPLNLAPTSSTTVALAIGDALAVALIKCRGFTHEDFALLHPSGSLGKRLLIMVEDIMHRGEELPLNSGGDKMSIVIENISNKRFGLSIIVGQFGALEGIITDGDLRRAFSKHHDISDMKACEIMSKNPKTIGSFELAAKALNIMQRYSISSLVVLEEGKVIGLLHFQDLLKHGLV